MKQLGRVLVHYFVGRNKVVPTLKMGSVRIALIPALF